MLFLYILLLQLKEKTKSGSARLVMRLLSGDLARGLRSRMMIDSGIKVPDLELAVQLAMCAGLMPQVPVRVILLALHSQLVLECEELCTYGVIWMF